MGWWVKRVGSRARLIKKKNTSFLVFFQSELNYNFN